MVLPCVAGDKLIVINEIGDVYPCEILPMKMGNLREAEYDIKRILSSKKAKKIKNFIKDTRCRCTFECATNANIVYDVKSYPKLLLGVIRNMISH